VDLDAADPFLIIVCGVLGLVIGSFLNVVVYRVPRDESIVAPRSRCPKCETALGPLEMVPVLSWVVLRGKCRHCKAPVSAEYAIVEALTGVLLAVTAWQLGYVWELPAYLVAVAGLVALSTIDVHTKRLPKKVFYPTTFATAALLVAAAFADGDWMSARDAALVGLAAFIFFFVLNFIYPRGLGFGDVRLSFLLGMLLGYQRPIYGFFGLMLGFVMGAIGGLLLIVGSRFANAEKKAGMKTAIPFGPWLAAGCFIGMLWGEAITDFVYPEIDALEVVPTQEVVTIDPLLLTTTSTTLVGVTEPEVEPTTGPVTGP